MSARDVLRCLPVIVVEALAFFLLRLIYGKGGEQMMAMLWAQQIMLGKKAYNQVPRLLKDQVKEILIDSGMESLVTEETAQ